MTHEPKNDWIVVHSDDLVIVMSAMCVCGDDDCSFTATAEVKKAVNVTRFGS
jgi:hypothetical protein